MLKHIFQDRHKEQNSIEDSENITTYTSAKEVQYH